MQINGIDKGEWNKFNDQYGTIFSSTKWLDLIGNYKLHGVYKGDELIGGFVDCDSLDIKLTPYHGVILKDESYEYPVMKALAELDGLKLVNHYSITDVRPFLWKGYKPTLRYTYIVYDLNPDKDTYRALNKAVQQGLTVKKGTVDDFWPLYKETFGRKGLELPVDHDWFQEFNKIIEPIIYMTDGAGAVIMSDSHRDYYIFGASAPNTGASSLVLSRAITRETDLVGCNNEKVGLFKRGFGGKLKCLIGVA